MSRQRWILGLCAVSFMTTSACEKVVYIEVPTDAECIPNGGPTTLGGSIDATGTTLSWETSATNHAGYLVQRQTEDNAAWLEIGRVDAATATYVDATAPNDTHVSYRVRAFRMLDAEECTSGPSSQWDGLTLPAPVQDLTGASTATTSIELLWTDPNRYVTGYRISRRVNAQPFVEVGTQVAPALSYLDTALSAGQVYDYQVLAVNDSGESAPTEVSVTSWVNPQLAWVGGPSLDPRCGLRLDGTITYGPLSGAAFGSATATVDRATNTITADESGMSCELVDLSAGTMTASWTVYDDFVGRSTLDRQMQVTLTTTRLAGGRTPLGIDGDLQTPGRQILYPGCADCQGGRAEIAVGANHACALSDQGQVYCWGLNGRGQLGNGRPAQLLRPEPVCAGGSPNPCAAQLGGAAAIQNGFDSSDEHTCATLTDGSVVCWGTSRGSLGDGTDGDKSFPTPLCGDAACGPMPQIHQLSTGSNITCAVVGQDREAWCWGQNDRGQLGRGESGPDALLPGPVCATGSTAGGDCTALDNVSAVAAGRDQHVCAATTTGQVYCWGDNYEGRLGTGLDVSANMFAPRSVCQPAVAGACDTGLVADLGTIASSHDHTCALVGGAVYCWGANSYGQLGDGTTDRAYSPVQACADDSGTCPPLNAVRVATGAHHTCAVVGAAGEVWCWGSGTSGRLGHGSTTSSRYPKPVCATGSHLDGSCVALVGASTVALGDGHSCALMNDGTVLCWGDNYDGQLGGGVTPAVLDDATNPVSVCDVGATFDGTTCTPGALQGATEIASGYDHVCAIASGQVYCWGDGYWAQNGEGTDADARGPVGVCDAGGWDTVTNACATGTPLSGMSGLALSEYHSCAIETATGTPYCWGKNRDRQLGVQTSTIAGYYWSLEPRAICASGEWDATSRNCGTGAPLTGVTSLSLSRYNSCGVLTSGEVWCWGDNTYGQLGRDTGGADDGAPAPMCADTAAPCTPLGSAGAVAAGISRTCVELAGGGVQCVGRVINAGVGVPDGGSTARPSPVCESGFGVDCVPLTGASSVIALAETSCARMSDASVRCWGYDSYDQAGDGPNIGGSTRFHPTRVCTSGSFDGGDCIALDAVDELTAGARHACARRGAEIYCWGEGGYGRLGNGSTTDADVAAPVCAAGGCAGNLTGVLRVSAGNDHTCATTATATYCWGYNSSGKLGDGSTTQATLPSSVCAPGSGPCTDWAGVLDVTAGDDISCAVDGAGGVWCWGHPGDSGVVADFQSELPTPVCTQGYGLTCVPLTGAVALGAGLQHSCAILGDGTTWCWGANDWGQLGNGELKGSFAVTAVPQQVCASGAVVSGVCDDGGAPAALQGLVLVTGGGGDLGNADDPLSHTCAITGAGEVVCWGSNNVGQLGNNATDTTFTAPILNQQVACPSTPGPGCASSSAALSGVVGLDLGYDFSCALLDTGDVRCWGANDQGQLGDDTFNQRLTATEVALGGLHAIAITTGWEHTCAVVDDSRVFCWGRNDDGQLGTGTPGGPSTTPQQVCSAGSGTACVALTGAISVAAGTNHTCAVLGDGSVRCWGYGAYGALGDGGSSFTPDYAAANPTYVCAPGSIPPSACSETPQPCSTSLTGVVAIDVGWDTLCALTDTAAPVCWGYGGLGLGDGGGATVQCAPRHVCLPGARTCDATSAWTTTQARVCDEVSVSDL